MMASLGSLALVLAMASTGQHAHHHHHHHGGFITPPGPGLGWGFPNGNPDGYGWYSYGRTLPMWSDRTTNYYFRREYALPTHQVFFPTYYNPYLTRGQRYLPYAGCGGNHPAGGPPLGSAEMPYQPYEDNIQRAQPPAQPPQFTGRTEGEPQPAGGSGLIP